MNAEGRMNAPLSPPLALYEEQAAAAVGRVIEFWGFKRNHGRLWTLLYLRGATLSSADLMTTLHLSKGAVSMLTKELEAWGVISRQKASDGLLRYRAEPDLLKMLTQVVRRRELSLVSEVRAELESAQTACADPEVRKRLKRLVLLARVTDETVQFLLKRVPRDLNDIAKIFSLKRRER